MALQKRLEKSGSRGDWVSSFITKYVGQVLFPLALELGLESFPGLGLCGCSG